MHEALLIGSNLALLTAACALGRKGRRVALLTDGGRMGGYFAGVSVESHNFDLGMVFLERPGETHSGPDIAGYDASVRNDCGRFSAHVAEFTESLVRTRRVPTPQALVAGRRYPDYMLCNRLDAIAALVTEPPREAAAMGASHPLHARNKFSGNEYEHLRYREAAEHNHGRQAQSLLFDPFTTKVLGTDPQLLARFHRSPWLPLYYPETIVDACEGRPSGLSEYAFWLPEQGWCGALVEAMVQELAAYPHVRVLPQAANRLERARGRWCAHAADGTPLEGQTLGMGVTHERARELLGLPPPTPATDVVSVRLGLFLVDEAAMRSPAGCLIVTDPHHSTYRLTDLDGAAGATIRWHRVVLEQGTTRVSDMGVELQSLLQVDDSRAVRLLKTVDAMRSLVVPSAEGLSTSRRELEQLHGAAADVRWTASLAAVGAASMNDQIIQGLQLAHDVAAES